MTKSNKKVNIKRNIKIYLGFLGKYKILVAAILFFVLLTETIHVAERYIFKILVDRGEQFSAGSIVSSIFVNICIILAVVFISMLIFKVIFKWLNMHLLNILETDLILDLKRYYFNHILTLSHSFHVSHKTGSLISRMSRGGSAMERITDSIVFSFAPLVFQLAVAFFSVIYFSTIPAIILGVTITAFITYNYYTQKIQRVANRKANQNEDIEKASIADIFTNMDAIKYFGKEEYIKGRFVKLTQNTKAAFLKHWNYFRWIDAGQTLILGIGTVLIVYFPLIQFINKEITLGTLVFIYTVYLNLLGPLFGFVHGMRDVQRVMIDFEDLFQYGDIQQEVKDKENAKEPNFTRGTIEFKDVSFSYGSRKIFPNLNIKVNENEKVAIVGHSGSGKTTLIKLLYRLYDVNSGSITIDGEDIKNFKQESLRSSLSIVPQEGILFDDTLYNNIAFSNPKATRKEVMNAIKSAQLQEFIQKLPKKEDTIVGERGVKLSGGERQRVSIARAILANQKILVLDEATSSLDSQTESQIQGALQELMKGRTSIIIAHRLSTIMRADKIIVMEKGKISQIGTHRELIKQPGIYQHLWKLQKGGYIGE